MTSRRVVARRSGVRPEAAPGGVLNTIRDITCDGLPYLVLLFHPHLTDAVILLAVGRILAALVRKS